MSQLRTYIIRTYYREDIELQAHDYYPSSYQTEKSMARWVFERKTWYGKWYDVLNIPQDQVRVIYLKGIPQWKNLKHIW